MTAAVMRGPGAFPGEMKSQVGLQKPDSIAASQKQSPSRETEDTWTPAVHHTIMAATVFPDASSFEVSTFTHIGGRKTQEDRLAVAPTLVPECQDCAFFGVFDGTVGDFASENVKELIIPRFIGSESWKALAQRLRQELKINGPRTVLKNKEDRHLLKEAMLDMYRDTDEALLSLCAQQEKHYATCTSVTAVVCGGLLAVGHLGDSRIAVGKDAGGVAAPRGGSAGLVGEFATVDHKPDTPEERARLEACGGSVEYLRNHQNKPFIRGGDFMMRKALGEQPMQLQYSRAFGGKDLKMFGLSNVPDVNVFMILPTTRWIILASDGLWDVCDAQQAVTVASQARSAGHSPAEALIRAAMQEQNSRNANADNVTAICVYFKPEKAK